MDAILGSTCRNTSLHIYSIHITHSDHPVGHEGYTSGGWTLAPVVRVASESILREVLPARALANSFSRPSMIMLAVRTSILQVHQHLA